MTRREYYAEVKKIVRKGIADRQAAQAELDEVMAKLNNSRMYSADHIQNVLRPMRFNLESQIRKAKDEAAIAVERLTNDYIAELESGVRLDGSALTDDANLLSVGVKLGVADLEKMFDKHNGNYTMQRLIADYAAQHDVKIGRTVHSPIGEEIKAVQSVPYAAERCVNWHDRPDFFEQTMGDNSSLSHYMNG